MENISGISICFDTGTDSTSPFFWVRPTNGFGRLQRVHGVSYLQHAKNFGMAADAYLNDSVMQNLCGASVFQIL